jgi:hypothetical protein
LILTTSLSKTFNCVFVLLVVVQAGWRVGRSSAASSCPFRLRGSAVSARVKILGNVRVRFSNQLSQRVVTRAVRGTSSRLETLLSGVGTVC